MDKLSFMDKMAVLERGGVLKDLQTGDHVWITTLDTEGRCNGYLQGAGDDVKRLSALPITYFIKSEHVEYLEPRNGFDALVEMFKDFTILKIVSGGGITIDRDQKVFANNGRFNHILETDDWVIHKR